MAHKNFISDHDIHLFQEALNNVQPLKEKYTQSTAFPVHHIENQTKSLSKITKPMSPATEPPKLDLHFQATLEPEEKFFFIRQGLQQKLFQKLKKGQIPVIASLDLHGMRANEALQALNLFLSRRTKSSQCCVCIIHGKGQGTPVLKNLVNHFLRQETQVLAFCSAPQNQGGAGATLVLLKSTQ